MKGRDSAYRLRTALSASTEAGSTCGARSGRAAVSRCICRQCGEDRMSGRVLLVDDDRSLCEWVQSALTKRGLTVTWRTSAAEALRTAGRGRLRRGRHRSQHARDERHRALRAHRGQPPRHSGGRDHGVRKPRDRPSPPSAPARTTSSTKPFELDALAPDSDRAAAHRRCGRRSSGCASP